MATARGGGSTVSASTTTSNTADNAAPVKKRAPAKSRVIAGFAPYPAEMPAAAEGRDALVAQIRLEMKQQHARIAEFIREAKVKKASNDWCFNGYRDFMVEAGLPEPVENQSSYRYSSSRTAFTQEPVVLEAVQDDVVQYLNDEGLRFYREKMWTAWLAQAATIRSALISYVISGRITTSTVTRILSKFGLEPARTVRNVQLTLRASWNLGEGDAITGTGLETAIRSALTGAGVPKEAVRGLYVTLSERISA